MGKIMLMFHNGCTYLPQWELIGFLIVLSFSYSRAHESLVKVLPLQAKEVVIRQREGGWGERENDFLVWKRKKTDKIRRCHLAQPVEIYKQRRDNGEE